jgi:hypothetical protein
MKALLTLILLAPLFALANGHDQDPNAPHNMGDPNAPHDMGPPPGHDQDPNAPHDMGPPPCQDPDGQQGNLMDPVDSAAEAAFEGALSNGASPEEAFEAGRVAAEAAGVEAGIPQEEIQAMTEAAKKDFDQGLMGPAADQDPNGPHDMDPPPC